MAGLAVCATCLYQRAYKLRNKEEAQGKQRHTILRGVTHKDRIELQCPVCKRARLYPRVEALVQEALHAIPLGTSDVATGQHSTGDVAAQVDALTARIEKVRARRGRLINRHELESDEPDYLPDDDYKLAMANNRQEEDMLQKQRDALVQGAQAAVSASVVLRWLATIESWTDILDMTDTTPAQRNVVYKQALSSIVLDFDASTVTIHWLPAIATIVGSPSVTDTVPRGKAKKANT